MAYVNASQADVLQLLKSGEYEQTQENVERCLHEVFGFSRNRMGEFGVEDESTALKPEDVGKNRWYGEEVVQHKTRLSGVQTCTRYVGYERKDQIWLNEGTPSEELLIELRNDPSYNQEISRLSRRREVS